jgi:hypothetical protein
MSVESGPNGRSAGAPPATLETSTFWAIILALIALLIGSGSQTKMLYAEREALAATFLAQAEPLAGAQRVRAQLDSIAAGTKRLAQGGNTRAQSVVEELRKRGVTINPDGPVATGASTQPPAR